MTSDSVFRTVLQPNSTVSTYAVPSENELSHSGSHAKEEARVKRMHQQVSMRLAENKPLSRQNGSSSQYAASESGNYYFSSKSFVSTPSRAMTAQRPSQYSIGYSSRSAIDFDPRTKPSYTGGGGGGGAYYQDDVISGGYQGGGFQGGGYQSGGGLVHRVASSGGTLATGGGGGVVEQEVYVRQQSFKGPAHRTISRINNCQTSRVSNMSSSMYGGGGFSGSQSNLAMQQGRLSRGKDVFDGMDMMGSKGQKVKRCATGDTRNLIYKNMENRVGLIEARIPKLIEALKEPDDELNKNITADVSSNQFFSIRARLNEGASLTSASLRTLSAPSNIPRTSRARHKDTIRVMLSWQRMVCEYKKSVDWKDQNERSFPSSERVSMNALYTEPVIIQKNKKGSFQNISVEELFNKRNINMYYSTIILQGKSGSGKSTIAQKIMLDWASEKHYLKDFDLAFCLRYEEVKCISEEMNLIELLSWNCSLTSDQISMMLQNSAQRVLLIIDGLDDLDELRFMYDEFCISSKFQKAPPEVIVCSLLRQQVLPRSVLLITTRTEVPQSMLLTGQQSFSRIVGFSEKGVEEYFQKFFQKEELFRRAYECVRANETLITACCIPVICWIICTVMRERFSDGAHVTSGLETTTSVYVDFVSTLLEHHCQGLRQSVPSLLKSLGQLAERGMLEQQVLFDEKSVHETISDPAGNPLLCKFLFKRRIGQEMMFSFRHRSFQDFFTALYYVLLDEEESKRKVRELLLTVERGWALSCCSDREANLEINNSKLLKPVILFLCGLCKKEWISSFFEKHNMAVPVNIETQLKEWINQRSKRYQNEHMLFILHCLYELHEKSFVGKVLEHLDSIDLSNILLKNADFWMLRFCFQNCANIGELKLNITSDNLKILQSTKYSCEELWLKVDHITDDTGDLISALGEGKIVKELIIGDLKASFEKGIESFCQEIITSVKDEDVTFPLKNKTFIVNLRINSHLSTHRHFHCQLENLPAETPEINQAFPSLSELGINSAVSFNPFDIKQSLRESLTKTGWILTVWRKSVLIERDTKSFTEEELKTNIESKRAESSLGQSCSGDAEVFTPECVQQDEDKHKTIYRFVCPHAGQFHCSLTSLMFVMEGEGEVLYNVVSWDPRLLVGFDQMKPAGPLYNIDCFNSSISRLHLPHCEIFSEETKDSLAAAHFTGGNVEIMKPLQVNETHVMIDIRDLSLFGLLKRMIFTPSPVCAQVLLFLRPITAKQRENILDVHLLPSNVPLSEVKDQHRENSHIKTSSKCCLTPGSEYSLCCEPEESTVQPETELFEHNFGPNYHPTFEVFVNVNTEEVRLSLSDETEGKDAWVPRRILLTGKDADSPAHKRLTDSGFVKKHRDELIQRVSSAMTIADGLMTQDMIPAEMYSRVHAAETRQEKMRLLLDVLDSGGAAVKTEFYRLLKKEEPHLVDELDDE